MKALTLAQVAQWCPGCIVQGATDAVITSVCTDSRALIPGCLFVPLSGELFDAHDFLSKAFASGAAAALSARRFSENERAGFGSIIQVDNTLSALQNLAARYRETLSDFIAVGVTGSNGKTTTKDFLSAILAQRFKVRATKGNLNNHIGLPLSVLSIEDGDRLGVFELGMNHFGEIAPLAAIIRPHAAVITNIGTAHIEFMGSREGIAEEKGRLVEAVTPDGCVVLNADDDMSPALMARTRARVLTAGLGSGDVRASKVRGTTFELVSERFGIPAGVCQINLPVPGVHMIGNALLAATLGLYFGLTPEEIRTGLEQTRVTGGRLQRRQVAGWQVLDDTYNANPDSMKAALRTLVAEPCAGRRVAVLGRMGELGAHAAAGHREVGEAARSSGIDFLLTVGDDEARWIYEAAAWPEASQHVNSIAAAVDVLKEFVGEKDLILVKGSRAAGMDALINLLEGQSPTIGAH